MAILNFDSTNVVPTAAPDPVPSGWYICVMTDSEMKPTSKNDGGSYLECEFTIVAPAEFKDRKLYDRMNLVNSNPTAVEIAYRTLSAICHAVGVIQVADSQQLHNRPLMIKTSLRPAGPGGDGKHYEASNEVRGYKAVENGTFQAPTAAPVAPIPAATWTPPTAPAPAPVAPAWAAAPVSTAPAATLVIPAAPTLAPAPTPPWQK